MSKGIACSILGIEQQISAGNLPVAGSDAIAQLAIGGMVGKKESVTRASTLASYQTTIRSKEVAFSPQGVRVDAD